MDILEVLVPLYLINQDYIEYASNAIVTIADLSGVSDFTNPSFEAPNLIALLPEFTNLIGTSGITTYPYDALFKAYRDIANQKFNYQVFGADWYLLMAFYIAHNMKLIFKSIENKGDYKAIGSDDVAGVVESGKAGNVEYKLNNMVSDKIFNDAGEYNLTQYGKRFWSTYVRYAKLLSKGLY